MVVQFIISGFVYFLLLLLTLGEEFKRCPSPLQSLCCWVHETKYARTVLMLTAITVNSVIASVNIVSLNVLILVILTVNPQKVIGFMLCSGLLGNWIRCCEGQSLSTEAN